TVPVTPHPRSFPPFPKWPQATSQYLLQLDNRVDNSYLVSFLSSKKEGQAAETEEWRLLWKSSAFGCCSIACSPTLSRINTSLTSHLQLCNTKAGQKFA